VDTFYTYTITVGNNTGTALQIDLDDTLPCNGTTNCGTFNNTPNPSFVAGHGVRFQSVAATNGLTCTANVSASNVAGTVTCGGLLANGATSVVTLTVSVRGNGNVQTPTGNDIVVGGTCQPIRNVVTMVNPAASQNTASNTINIVGCSNTPLPTNTAAPTVTLTSTNTVTPTGTLPTATATVATPTATAVAVITINKCAQASGTSGATTCAGSNLGTTLNQNGATGTPFQYRIEVNSTNAQPSSGIQVTDNLPAGFAATSVTVVSGGFSCSQAGQTVTCTGGTVSSGTPGVIQIAGSFNTTASCGATLTDTATVVAPNGNVNTATLSQSITCQTFSGTIKNTPSNPSVDTSVADQVGAAGYSNTANFTVANTTTGAGTHLVDHMQRGYKNLAMLPTAGVTFSGCVPGTSTTTPINGVAFPGGAHPTIDCTVATFTAAAVTVTLTADVDGTGTGPQGAAQFGDNADVFQVNTTAIASDTNAQSANGTGTKAQTVYPFNLTMGMTGPAFGASPVSLIYAITVTNTSASGQAAPAGVFIGGRVGDRTGPSAIPTNAAATSLISAAVANRGGDTCTFTNTNASAPRSQYSCTMGILAAGANATFSVQVNATAADATLSIDANASNSTINQLQFCTTPGTDAGGTSRLAPDRCPGEDNFFNTLVGGPTTSNPAPVSISGLTPPTAATVTTNDRVEISVTVT
jgi:hypothetical protein